MNKHLKPECIVKTLRLLHQRILERFPGSGLAGVCGDLVTTAEVSATRARRLRRPFILLRALLFIAVGAAIVAQIYAMGALDLSSLAGMRDALVLAQALDSAANLVILAGAAIWFLASLEERIKRHRVLNYLHELRSYSHVIDMHQLTKDPTVTLRGATLTKSSPKREMNSFQLSRYLDYCSEMLALTSKLAALYAEGTQDTNVIAAANEIENLSTNLGRKIWQKIMIINRNEGGM